MVGHQHVRVANLFIELDDLHEVDVALIWIHLYKIVAVTTNVPEMHVEYFLTTSKVANDIEDLRAWILQHLGNRSLAKIQAMVRTLVDANKLLQTINRSQHAIHTLI